MRNVRSFGIKILPLLFLRRAAQQQRIAHCAQALAHLQELLLQNSTTKMTIQETESEFSLLFILFCKVSRRCRLSLKHQRKGKKHVSLK